VTVISDRPARIGNRGRGIGCARRRIHRRGRLRQPGERDEARQCSRLPPDRAMAMAPDRAMANHSRRRRLSRRPGCGQKFDGFHEGCISPCLNCEVEAARTVPVNSHSAIRHGGRCAARGCAISRRADIPDPEGAVRCESHAQLGCEPRIILSAPADDRPKREHTASWLALGLGRIPRCVNRLGADENCQRPKVHHSAARPMAVTSPYHV